MAEDVQSNIRINIDSADALANLKNLQRQISIFQEQMSKSNAAMQASASRMQGDLINSINRTGQFNASIKSIKSTTESFTESLEKNKFSIGEYFRYAGGASKTFGKVFKSEFDTIEKVARERVKTLQTQYVRLGRDANGALKAIAVRPLTLDMQNLGTQMAITAQKQALMNQLLKQGSTQLLNWGKNTQWAGRQLMVGFTVPLTIMGTTASKVFMEMEEQVIKFKRVYGDMTTMSQDTDKMAKEIQRLATEFTKYGVAASKTMELAAQAASQGKMGADLLAQVTSATRLAVLGNVEQQQALETTISITNAFGVATEELAGKIDFLNAVENQTITSIEDLTIAVPKAGPVVQQLGGDVEDLAFFLTAMKEGGINASEGANALKSGLASLINPTTKASEMLAGFGVNIKGIVEANKGDVKGTVVEFAKALDTLDPLNRARAIEQLFGKFQFSRLSTLFQNVIKDGSQASKVLELTRNTTEELAILSEREMKRIEASPMYKFKKAIEDIKISLIPLGEAFLKAVTPIIQLGTKALKWFDGLDNGVKSFVTNLIGIAGVIAPALIMGVGLIANAFANVLKIFTFFKTRINGTTSASSELTTQTSYLTQAQLEAAAVAASLDQTHQRLTQAFTSEAGAVLGLRDAYQQTTAAQAAFANANSSMANTSGAVIPDGTGKRRGPWKGLAEGGFVKGPGTGTSDSIPAMLSNGEAVIPADKAKKYGPIVNRIIDGDVPGFFTGRRRRNVSDISLPEEDVTFITDAAKKLSSGAGQQEKLFVRMTQEFDAVRQRGEQGKTTKPTEEVVSELKGWLSNLIASKSGNITSTGLASEYKASGREIHSMYSSMGASEDQTRFAHIGSGMRVTAGDALAGIQTWAEPVKKKLEAISQLFPDKMVDIKHGFGIGLAQSTNQGLAKTGANIADVARDFSAIPNAEKYGKAIEIGGGDSAALAGQTGILNDEVLAIIRQKQDEGVKYVVDSEDEISKLRQSASDKNKQFAESEYATLDSIVTQARQKASEQIQELNAVLDVANNTVTEVRFQATPEEKASAGRLAGYNADSMSSLGGNTIAGRKKGGLAPGASMAQLDAKTDAEEYSAKRAEELKGKDPYVESRDRNSPHAFSGQDGSDDARSYTDHFNAEIDQQNSSGPSKLLPPAPGMDPNDPFSSRNGNPFENYEQPKPTSLRDKARGMAGSIGSKALGVGKEAGMGMLEKIWMNTVGKKFAKASGEVITGRDGKVLYDPTKDIEAEKAREMVNEQIEQNAENALMANDAAYNALAAESKIYEQKKVMSGISVAEYEQELARQQQMSQMRKRFMDDPANADANSPEGMAKNERKARLRKISGRVSMGLGAVAGVAGTIAAMPGVPGAVSGLLGGATASIGAAASVMSMIPGPAGMVAGALVGLGTATGMVIAMLNENQKKAMELQSNLSTGNAAMKKYADFAGNVTASEVMNKRRSAQSDIFQIAAGKTSFGQSFMQSDAGKSLLSSVKDSKTFAGSMNSAGGAGGPGAKELMTQQLLAAVTSGALTSAQARSVAAAMGKELNDTTFGIDVAGKLLSLTGPNGENLTKDPFTLRAKVVADTRKTTEDLAKNQKFTGGTFFGMGARGTNFWDDFLDVSTLGIASLVRESDNAGKAAGAWQAQAAALLETTQQQIDSLDLEYEKRIANAEAAGNLAKAEELTNEHIAARKKLTDEQKLNYDSLVTTAQNADSAINGTRDKMSDAANKAIENKFAGTGQEAMATAAKDTIDQMGGGDSKGAQIAIKSLVGAGQLGLSQVDTAAKLFGKNDAGMKNFSGLISSVGGVEANKALSLAAGFGESKAQKAQAQNFLLNVKNAGGVEGKKIIDAMMLMQKSGLVMKPQMILSYFEKNPDKAKKIKSDIDAITKASGKSKKITTELITKQLGQDVMDAVKTDQEYFDSLPKEQQLVYLTTAKTALELQQDPQWLADKALYEKEIGKKISNASYAAHLGNLETKSIVDVGAPGDKSGNTTGGGGGGTNPLDEILNRLKMVRDASINAKGGITELLRVMGKAGGNNLTMFKGVEQNLINRDKIMPGFLDFYNGLDDAAKKTYVKITGHGDKAIARLTDKGKAVNAALAEIAIGDFQVSQTRQNQDLKNQATAFTKLRAAGLGYKDALEMSKNAELANAIALKGSAKEIQNIVNLEKQRQALEDPKARFDRLMSQAQERFSAEKNAIDIKFKMDTKAFNKTIADAQNEIAKLNNQAGGMDDLQAGLTQIGWAEEEINKKYEERFKALDKVAESNAKISEQQKGQLSLAEALTRGDISAAAAAVQDARAKSSEDAMANQRKAMEASKQAEIDGLTASVNGKSMTKKQISEAILSLEKQIFDIEEKRLEPAQYQNSLLEIQKNNQLAAIEAQEDKWAGLQSQIDLAITAGYDLEAAYLAAAAAAASIKIGAANPADSSNAPGSNADGGAKSGASDGSGGSGGTKVSGGVKTTIKPLTPAQKAAAALDVKIKDLQLQGQNAKNKLAAAEYVFDNKSNKTNLDKVNGIKYEIAMIGQSVSMLHEQKTKVLKKARGGIIPKYFVDGGFATGTDTVPAMLTPGEFIMTRHAVDNFGVDNLRAINSGASLGDSVYNYNLSVSMSGSNLNPNDVARAVMTQIKQIDSQRLRGNRL